VGPASTWVEISRSGTTEAARVTAAWTTSLAVMAEPVTSCIGTRPNGSTTRPGWITCTTCSAHPRTAASAAAHSIAWPPPLSSTATTTSPLCRLPSTESPTERDRRFHRLPSQNLVGRFCTGGVGPEDADVLLAPGLWGGTVRRPGGR
jgi:hypothetical protein